MRAGVTMCLMSVLFAALLPLNAGVAGKALRFAVTDLKGLESLQREWRVPRCADQAQRA